MTMWFRRRKQSRQARQIEQLQSDLEAANRKLAVAEAEIESLAAVIARDRQRIKAETAAYARQQAHAEGITNDERTDESIRRFVS